MYNNNTVVIYMCEGKKCFSVELVNNSQCTRFPFIEGGSEREWKWIQGRKIINSSILCWMGEWEKHHICMHVHQTPHIVTFTLIILFYTFFFSFSTKRLSSREFEGNKEGRKGESNNVKWAKIIHKTNCIKCNKNAIKLKCFIDGDEILFTMCWQMIEGETWNYYFN